VSIKAVLIGGVVDILSSIILELPIAIYAAIKVAVAHTPKDQIAGAVSAATHRSPLVYSVQLLIGLACSVLGGYVAAWSAKHDEILNGALSSILCTTLGVWLIASGKGTEPLWEEALLLIASPIFAALGGYLRARQKQAVLRAI
jgi:hypothetical protein